MSTPGTARGYHSTYSCAFSRCRDVECMSLVDGVGFGYSSGFLVVLLEFMYSNV